jgi:hypothetical protein
MQSGFFALVTLWAIARLLATTKAPTGRSRPALIVLGLGALVAQFYAGFYLGWFLTFGLCIAVLVATVRSESRTKLLEQCKEQAPALLVSGVVAASVLAPLALHYWGVATELGFREYAEVEPMVPRLQSWIHCGGESWGYGLLSREWLASGLGMEHEHRLGIGLVTLTLSVLGLVLGRSRPAVRLMSVVGRALFVLTLSLWGKSLWRFVFATVPGAAAVRAVSRVSLVTLIPLCVGLALVLESQVGVRRRGLFVVLLVVYLVEQGAALPSYDKSRVREHVAAIAAAVPAEADAFLYTPKAGKVPGWHWLRDHVDAMWVSLETGVPTVNGYSGNHPRDWLFYDIHVGSQSDLERLDRAGRHWFDFHDQDSTRIRWIR